MNKIYSKKFAEFYNKYWDFLGDKYWGFISKYIKKNNIKVNSWLDLCCGSGSLLKHISKTDIICFGVDSSKYQIKFARTNAPNARLICDDIRSFYIPKKFDVITCMLDSLNYLSNKNDLMKVFKNVKIHLEINGVFIFDINVVEGWEKAWGHNVVFKEKDKFLIVENCYDDIKNYGKIIVTGFIKNGRPFERFEEVHIERCYFEKEIDEMLDKTNFTYHKYDGNLLIKTKKRSGRILYICK